MTTGMIKGMPQVVEYDSADTRLYYIVKGRRGKEAVPDATPNIAIADQAGTELIAATAMTMSSVTDEGLLAYDALATDFTVGEKLTGGTSDATAIIVDIDTNGAAGVLRLANIDGTFLNNEALTDSGGGAATANLTLYSHEYYYSLDTSATETYPVTQNLIATITYAIGTEPYTRRIYFDVALSPMVYPVVTNADVNEEQPTWLGRIPDTWKDWTPAIKKAHAKLVHKIHAHNELAADYIKRESEFWRIAMAFTKDEIASSCGFEDAEQKKWSDEASAAWGARGALTVNKDSTSQLEGDKEYIAPGFTR